MVNRTLLKLKGKDYLPTNERVKWFRDDNPDGAVTTEIISFDPLVVKATVVNGNGQILGVDHAGAKPQANAVWSGREVEKACTAAIGRALALAGYGTLQAMREETHDNHLADSPVEPRNANANGRSQPPRSNAPAPAQPQGKPASNVTPITTAQMGNTHGPIKDEEPKAATNSAGFTEYHVTDIRYMQNKDGNQWVLKTREGQNVVMFSSDRFREAGIKEDVIALWKKVGNFRQDTPMSVWAKFGKNSKGNDGWTVDRIVVPVAEPTELDKVFSN